MKRVVPREFGTLTMTNKQNEELTPAGDAAGTPTANGALPITASRLFRLNGSSLAMTVAAPNTNGSTEGVELDITNIAASTATVTVTGMDTNSGADVFTMAAAATTNRSIMSLKCRNVGTKASPSYKWVAFMYSGVTVA